MGNERSQKGRQSYTCRECKGMRALNIWTEDDQDNKRSEEQHPTNHLYHVLHLHPFYSYRNLEGNPLHCNCHLSWLAEWLRTHGARTGIPKCHSPPPVLDTLITDVPSSQFLCDGECLPAYLLVSRLLVYAWGSRGDQNCS